MELLLERIAKRKAYTIGRLKTLPQPLPVRDGSGLTQAQDVSAPSLQGGRGESLLCDTLEPPVLQMKTTVSQEAVLRSPEKAQSLKPFAIPEGRYAVVISYSPKMQQWLPILLGVPAFSGIRIHAGNSVEDTQGCILLGDNLKPGRVFNSRLWLHRLKKLIVDAKAHGEAVWLTIR